MVSAEVLGVQMEVSVDRPVFELGDPGCGQ